MAWNKPNNNESKLDPWGKKHSNEKDDSIKNNDEKKTIKKKNAVDIKTFLCKIGNVITPANNSSNKFKKTDKPFFMVFFISFFLWCAHGFYIIKENERGVVTTFGKLNKLVEPGLNWRPVFINDVSIVNFSHMYDLTVDKSLLTLDKNILHIIINIQYKMINPVEYLFSSSDPENVFRQTIESSIHSIVGNININQIMNEGEISIQNKIEKKIKEIIKIYKMGMSILDINLQIIEVPKKIQSFFEDTIIARANRDKSIHESIMYLKNTEYEANRQAEYILELAKSYASHIILEAEREAAFFSQTFLEDQIFKNNIFQHFYLKSMEKLCTSMQKMLIDQDNVPVLSLNKFLNDKRLIKINRNCSCN